MRFPERFWFGTEAPCRSSSVSLPVARRAARSVPPRRCVDLQRVTAWCSRSSGFPAPPSSFAPHGVDPGVFHPADWLVGFPSSRCTAHGLALALEDLCCVSVPLVRPVQAPSFFAGPPPLRFVASSALPVRGIHFPARLSSRGSHPGAPASPRRGLPHPLWSASVVFHDPGGLLLPEPCGVFQPLTPVRFVSRLPRAEARGGEFRPATACYRCRGPGPPGRVPWCGRRAEACLLQTRCAPDRPSRRTSRRLRLPTLLSASPIGSPRGVFQLVRGPLSAARTRCNL